MEALISIIMLCGGAVAMLLCRSVSFKRGNRYGRKEL